MKDRSKESGIKECSMTADRNSALTARKRREGENDGRGRWERALGLAKSPLSGASNGFTRSRQRRRRLFVSLVNFAALEDQ